MKNHVVIIAEAGVNHNGDINIAKKLIDEAVLAQVDYIKFQTFKTESNISTKAQKANYQKSNTIDSNESQFEMVKKLELSFDDFISIDKYCQKKGIKFLSTGFDFESITFLDTLGVPFFKIPSGEINNKPYLEFIAKKGKPVILSTGMAELSEIGEAINILMKGGVTKKHITVLHCNTEYPTPMKDVNLNAMLTIKKAFNVEVGYSDHTMGIEVPIAAVALGATVIEKHFTLDRNMEGPDHKASLEPTELKRMVESIRNIELALSGSGLKNPSNSEKKNISIARKSIHLAKSLTKGTLIDESCLLALRPGDGISPMNWDSLIGKELTIDLPYMHKLRWEDLK